MPMEVESLTLAQVARPQTPDLPTDRGVNLSAADVLDRVRDLLPDADAATLTDAAETFAALLNSEDRTYWQANREAASSAGLLTMATPDAGKFAGVKGGGIVDADIASAVPDSWRGEHVVKRGRSKRGATAKVTSRGVAPVIGARDRDVFGNPLLALPTHDLAESVPTCVAARLLVTRGLHQYRAGVSSLDVTRCANDAFRNVPGFDVMVGTDAESYAQSIPGDRTSVCRVARHVSDLAGSESPALGRFAQPDDVHASHTDRQRWTLRGERPNKQGPQGSYYAIPMGALRKGETRTSQPNRVHVVIRHRLVTGRQVFAVTELASATDTPATHRYIGFRRVARPAPATRGKRASVKRARTIGHVPDVPTTCDAWTPLLDMLNRGERVTIGDHVTITRGKAGKYRATDKRGAVTTYHETRSVDAMAIRLAT